jgi:hypothetical protein
MNHSSFKLFFLGQKKKLLQQPIRSSFQMQQHQQVENKGWIMTYHGNMNQKKVGVATLIADKVNL